MPVNPTDDQPADEHHNAFETEIPMICWIKKKCPHFPVPIMRHIVRRSEVEPHTFAIMELPGVPLMNVFGDLPFPIQASSRTILSLRCAVH